VDQLLPNLDWKHFINHCSPQARTELYMKLPKRNHQQQLSTAGLTPVPAWGGGGTHRPQPGHPNRYSRRSQATPHPLSPLEPASTTHSNTLKAHAAPLSPPHPPHLPHSPTNTTNHTYTPPPTGSNQSHCGVPLRRSNTSDLSQKPQQVCSPECWPACCLCQLHS
jgi:hypothetical protein